MEWRNCPICGSKNLMESNVKGLPEKLIVCQNERYVHARIGMVDMLIKTEIAKRDEDEELQLVIS